MMRPCILLNGMAQLTTAPEHLLASRHGERHRWWRISGVLLLTLVAVASVLFSIKWPFSRAAMIRRLERASQAHVAIRSFRSTYFPPGCVAEDVVFTKAEQTKSQRLLTIEHLRIQSSYHGLLGSTKKIDNISVSGAHLYIPSGQRAPQGQGTAKSKSESLVIAEFEVKDSVLELSAKEQNSKPLQFAIHDAVFRNLASGRTVPFSLAMRVPLPPGGVRAGGWIGPWRDDAGTVRSTPVSGSAVLEKADLGAFRSLAGTISAHVNFSGSLEQLNIAGTTDSQDFEVRESGHKLPLRTEFAGTVDLHHGDVELRSLKARLGKTDLAGDARITGYPKTVQLNVLDGRGEVEDLMLLFSNKPRSPITGPIRFHLNAVLPHEGKPFKERVRLTGAFDVEPAKFTPNTQAHVDQLSQRARGEKDKDPQDAQEVLSRLEGEVTLDNGIAEFPGISFAVPGAVANMHGTYSLINKRVDLHGKMKMEATVSQATKGVKSFFLKILDPFFKKKSAGADVPVAMTGMYGHTHFSVGLTKK